MKKDKKNILFLVLAYIFMASVICLFIKTGVSKKSRYEILEEKIDKIASQTDATAEKVDSLDIGFEEYKQEQSILIEQLQKQLNDFQEEMQDEIDRIDEDIEAVEIAKAEARQKRQQAQAQVTYAPTYTTSTDGLNAYGGINYYGEHRESWYNENMSNVINTAYAKGVTGEYWIRDDGVKMLGDYVIVSANQDLYPYGSTVETSKGTGIVVDTGPFIYQYPEGYDIATDW